MSANGLTKVAKLGFLGLGLTFASAAFGLQAPELQQPAGEAAAQPAATGAPLDAAKIEKGRQLFNDWSCGTCHVLTDAGGTGHVGPSLDGNKTLTTEFIVNRVTNGAGPMPGFGGQMTDAEIAELSAYINQVAVR